ncbi:MAG: CoB--CoM heterodisulfide reductase subunit B [Halobacteriota archaeon]
MKEYNFFLGCIAPNRYPGIEASAVKTSRKFDIELRDFKGASCCPAPGAFGSMDVDAWLALGARNICLSEQEGKDITLVCNGCYKSLFEANHRLKADPVLKDRINAILANVNMEFKGSQDVRHLIDIYYNDVGPEKVKESVEMPLTGLNVAIHYGCHLLKPKFDRTFGSTERPRFFDELVEATGATSVDYKEKMMCCGAGGGVRSFKVDLALDIANEKLYNMTQAGADVIVNVCPFCQLQLDRGQVEIKEKFGDSYDLPVLHYNQLLGLAQGMNPEELGLDAHEISVEPLLAKIL